MAPFARATQSGNMPSDYTNPTLAQPAAATYDLSAEPDYGDLTTFGDPNGRRPQARADQPYSVPFGTVAPATDAFGSQVRPEDRDRAERHVSEAYAEARINEFEFDARMEQVLSARTRVELNGALQGLAPSQHLQLPAMMPRVGQGADTRSGKLAASLAHFSALGTSMFGPLFFYMIAGQGTFAKHQAARAFNFQLIAFLGATGAGIIAGVLDIGFLIPIVMVGWFVLTLIGGVKASQGEEWTDPVSKVIRWRPLDEKKS